MRVVQKLACLWLLMAIILLASVEGFAQTQAVQPLEGTSQPQTPESRQAKSPAMRSRPQVVTILHRLNGLKMFRLLLRSGDVRAVARLDDAFNLTGQVHTNVIAGLALDDGQTIAAWLPEAEAEFGLPPSLAPAGMVAGDASPSPVPHSPAPPADAPSIPAFAGMVQPANLTVIGADGKRLVARYIGIDGVTGLSVLKLTGKSFAQMRVDAQEGKIGVGQRVRLFGPEPAAGSENTSGVIFARMGETEGKISNISRAPSGGIARVKVRSGKISPSIIGGIALNDLGETLGIVDAVQGQEATILPAALIRGAARRVLDRQASVPRPWLGIRGEAIGAVPLQQILLNGWKQERALSLLEHQRGILLTSVAPGSPASGAALQPGDVILRVNNEEIRNADEFSWLLEDTGPGELVRFTIARPGKSTPEAIEVQLTESPDPFFVFRNPEALAARLRKAPRPTPTPRAAWSTTESSPHSLAGALMASGLETIALKRNAAVRFGAAGGLLVVFVQPSTPASKAGLRPGDLIEAIDGRQVLSTSDPVSFSATPGASYSFAVVRNRQKLSLTLKIAQ
ncbi:MAG TPA: PDZ domain-containing protein [Pyrinomonadaceae bacterium]|nr:PDZ domain-containing protein [Pyrinomonadaceae bacterium]